MTEAVSALNDYVFNVLKHNKIVVSNFSDNQGSHHIKRKTGSTFIKSYKEKWRDEIREVELWELTAEDWNNFIRKEL